MLNGLIQVYTGDSKGKTTAALGLTMRAIGHDLKVYFIQFMKGSNYYGEIVTLNKLHPHVKHAQFGRPCRNSGMIKQGIGKCSACGKCFIRKGEDVTEDRKEAQVALQFTKELMESGKYDILVLDEILNCIFFGLLTEEEVLDIMKTKPQNVELVLTGRNASEAIIEKADLVTEMKGIKHPYEKGVMARRGIEY